MVLLHEYLSKTRTAKVFHQSSEYVVYCYEDDYLIGSTGFAKEPMAEDFAEDWVLQASE